MNKPTKPNITIPESFAANGIKTDFDNEKLTNGFDCLQPDVLAGDNLNKLIDDTYKGLNYGIAAGDAINLIQEGETLTVQNGQLVSGSTGGGLEVCDIGMALYVDETKGLRRYLNGQIVDINTNTQAFLNRLKDITTLHPSLLCTEDEWQTAKTMSAFGQVGKFVFNYSGDEVVSVRIPRVVNVQGLFDLQNLGLTVEAGLPNHKHSISNARSSAGLVQFGSNGGSMGFILETGLVNNSAIYGKSNTVQPESIQYPYFIQIATGSETKNNIVNDIELNNPFSLFDSKYSDHELNNISWLKSEGQWNSKAVYPTAYDKLLKVYNGTETVEGLSVKLSTEDYTDYDFVLNTADETFRLPLKNHTADDGNNVLTLYYYVGETVQNANLINAGRIGETKTDKVQAAQASMPSNKYIDLTLGASGTTYTAPANGWIYWVKITGGDWKYINLKVLKKGIDKFQTPADELYSAWSADYRTNSATILIPIKKGYKYETHYNATGKTENFRFIYAEGEQ